MSNDKIIAIIIVILAGIYLIYYNIMPPTVIDIQIHVKENMFIIKDQTFCDEIIYLTKIKETYKADSIVYYKDNKKIVF